MSTKVCSLALASSLLGGCVSRPPVISEMSPQRAYKGPRLEGSLEIEVKIFPPVMLRPAEGWIFIKIHGSEDAMPQCSGWKIQYERSGSSERLACELPQRSMSIPYHWREYGNHKIIFLLFDLEKQTIAATGYGDLQIGAE